MLVQIPPALDNAGALEAGLPATEPGGSSPTHLAMREAVDLLIEHVGSDPSLAPHLVLVTDSVPRDICVGGVGGDSSVQKQELLLQVDRALDAGIRTFVVNMVEDAGLQQYLHAVALRGQPALDGETYTPRTSAELSSALHAIVSDALACLP